MQQSHVFAFADPYSYEDAARLVAPKLVVTSRGDFRAELIQIDLERLWMQRSEDTLSRILRVSVPRKRTPIMFLADARQASIQHSGVELSPGQIVVYGEDVTEHLRNSGPCRTAGMSLTREDWDAAAMAITGRALSTPSKTHIIQPTPASMARLEGLYEATTQLTRTAPETLAHPAVTKSLEQALVHAAIRCLTGHMQTAPKGGAEPHAKIMARFEEFLANRQYQPVYLAEICAAIAASERTLRTCCHEHLGVGPIRYLWLRRMHLARRALLRAQPAEVSVTEIATEFGFWELGRFSVEYHALFGESPSVSLHRPAE